MNAFGALNCSSIGQDAEGDTTGSFSVIQSSMERLNELKEEVLTSWNDHNIRLELYVQWKVWDRDSHEVSCAKYFELASL